MDFMQARTGSQFSLWVLRRETVTKWAVAVEDRSTISPFRLLKRRRASAEPSGATRGLTDDDAIWIWMWKKIVPRKHSRTGRTMYSARRVDFSAERGGACH